jgi:hypothetical protein
MTHHLGPILALAALPLLAAARPDAPRAPDSEPPVRTADAAPPARIARAALLLEPPAGATAPDTPDAHGAHGAVVFEETTLTTHDGARVVTLAARYRVFGLRGSYEANFRLRVEAATDCAGAAPPSAGTAAGAVSGKVLGQARLERFNDDAEGSYADLQAEGLTLADAIVGHAVTVRDPEDRVVACGVARPSPEQAPPPRR